LIEKNVCLFFEKTYSLLVTQYHSYLNALLLFIRQTTWVDGANVQ